MKKRLLTYLLTLLALATVLPAAAQEGAAETPSVTVSDQFATNYALIDDVVSAGPGWLVIHIDANGSPGPVAGFAPVIAGHNPRLRVPFDATVATPVLYAMLHEDTGEAGVYEFGTVEGADLPVIVGTEVVTPPFSVALIDALPQFVTDNTVTVRSVTAPQDGWLVIHSDANGAPGPVLGQTQIPAGTSANVVVELTEGEATDVLWPMLHVDTGEIGVYEFGTVEGADSPVIVNGAVATTPISTVPDVVAWPQPIRGGENRPPAAAEAAAGQTPTFRAQAVLSEGPGFLVIHTDANNSPGPVIGFEPVNDGLTENVEVTLQGDITPVVWPMLHVDTGEIGVYEFGTVEGADLPVLVNESVLTFPVAVAPSITATQSEVSANGEVTVDQTVIDAPGWLVIHADDSGRPGPVLGQTALGTGFAENVTVPVDTSGVGTQVFPMLHYDTGETGVYEFGTVEGADLPVLVNEAVVVVPMAVTTTGQQPTGEATAPAEAPPAEQTPSVAAPVACSVGPAGASNVNIRAEPTTASIILRVLSVGTTSQANGQASVDGFTWYQLVEGGWVRGDVVAATGDCASLPTLQPVITASPAAPAQPPAQQPTVEQPPAQQPPPPATTPEAGS